jgi:hypothetical protein
MSNQSSERERLWCGPDLYYRRALLRPMARLRGIVASEGIPKLCPQNTADRQYRGAANVSRLFCGRQRLSKLLERGVYGQLERTRRASVAPAVTENVFKAITFGGCSDAHRTAGFAGCRRAPKRPILPALREQRRTPGNIAARCSVTSHSQPLPHASGLPSQARIIALVLV